jgi:hypothetical protein
VSGNAVLLALLLSLGLLGCATPAPPARAGAEGPSLVLDRFVEAARAGRFTDAHRLLSARWRQRVSPARLAEDFAAEPLAGRRLAATAGAALRTSGSRAEAPLGEGRTLVLVEEPDGWRVDRLE